MSTTVELVRANERYARLRAAVEKLADGIDDNHWPIEGAYSGVVCAECTDFELRSETSWPCPQSRHAADLRALLAAADS